MATAYVSFFKPLKAATHPGDNSFCANGDVGSRLCHQRRIPLLAPPTGRHTLR